MHLLKSLNLVTTKISQLKICNHLLVEVQARLIGPGGSMSPSCSSELSVSVRSIRLVYILNRMDQLDSQNIIYL